MDSAALGRHLRSLSELDAFDYVPPFRGRAVHMRKHDIPFAKLVLDFDTLERQKKAEYDRLDRVLQFARQVGCRQRLILEYFGQRDAEACGHCDNCARQGATSSVASKAPAHLAGAVTDAVKIVLSGVARIARSHRFGCGKTLLAQMLCGSSSKTVTRNRLDKLSTFGLLSHLKQPQVVELIDALLVCGLLEQTEVEKFRPVVQLTERGAEAMAGRDDRALDAVLRIDSICRLAPHLVKGGSPPPQSLSSPLAGNDAALVDRLKQWRLLASRAESVPAFRVLSNATLEELARASPAILARWPTSKGLAQSRSNNTASNCWRCSPAVRIAGATRRHARAKLPSANSKRPMNCTAKT